MPKRSASLPPQPILLGDSAAALEIAFLLLLDAVAIGYPPIAAGLVDELDRMLAHRLPTPGIQARLAELREHLAGLIHISGNGLPN